MQIENYLLSEQIYSGKRFSVYKGKNSDSNTQCIVKLLDKSKQYSPDNPIKKEYEFLSSITHENVIKAIDYIENSYYALLVLEDFAANDLKQSLKEEYSIQQFLNIAIQISNGLSAVHQQNIIHKDINPSNIVINNNTLKIKIIDFDIATRFELKLSDFSNPDLLQGTFSYLSPEQTGRMNRLIDYRTDFYSLGITLYEILTGHLPFESTDKIDLVHSHIAKKVVPPHKVKKETPLILSNIIMKLLSKNASERYQSAEGLIADLNYVLQNLKSPKLLGKYQIAESDFSSKFTIPETLYGREGEIKQINNAFNRVKLGENVLVMVPGYSGVGKTTLINELHRPVTECKGYFLRGKFDQLENNKPYTAFRQVFYHYCQLLLSENQHILTTQKDAINNTVGNLGGVLIDLVPELELILGKQPELPKLAGAEASNRFNYAIQRFVKVIASKNHPIVIFLDDMQWADQASLKLFKLISLNQALNHIMVIGAYRDNEVNKHHPLSLTLHEIEQSDKAIQDIQINDLKKSDIENWLNDTLGTQKEQAQFLAFVNLIYKKTKGNPFFFIQLLKNLYNDKLIWYNLSEKKWICNIEEIKKQSYTDNVIDLLLKKISTLDDNSLEILQIASCFGNCFAMNNLKQALSIEQKQLSDLLNKLVNSNFIQPLKESEFCFIHDRIQQAVYDDLKIEKKEQTHYKLGKILLQEGLSNESIFEITDHFNISNNLLKDESERLQIAELNLKAAKRSKDTAAHIPAYNYVKKALELLPDNPWKNNYSLTLETYKVLVETSYLTGNFSEVNHFLEVLDKNATQIKDKYSVIEYSVLGLNAQGKFQDAVEKVIQIVNKFGINLNDATPSETAQIIQSLTPEKILELVNLPEMTKEETLVIMRLFLNSLVAFFFAAPHLVPSLSQKSLEIIFDYGYCPEAPFFLAFYSSSSYIFFKAFKSANAYGKTAMELIQTRETNKIAKVRANFLFNSYLNYFNTSMSEVSSICELESDNAIIAGDIEYAAYFMLGVQLLLIHTNKDLNYIIQKSKYYSELIQQLYQAVSFGMNEAIRSFCSSFLLKNKNIHILDFSASKFTSNPVEIARIQLLSNILSLIYCYIFEKNNKAIGMIDAISGTFEQVPIEKGSPYYNQFVFFSTLLLIKQEIESKNAPDSQNLQKIESNIIILKEYLDYGSNYIHRFYLAEAENNFLKGSTVIAFQLYDKAIQFAKENDFLCDEAVSNECAAKAYLNLGLHKSAKFYFQEALSCYKRWGANRKIKHLEDNYPKYTSQIAYKPTTGAINISTSESTTTTSLDISSILKASQTLSGEIQVNKLLEKVLDTIIENAGAQFGTFIQNKDGKLIVLAKGSKDESKNTMLNVPLDKYNDLPFRVVNYVMRSKEPLLFENLSKDTDYLQDKYVARVKPKSAICYPVLHQGNLTALLYLENNLTEGAFTDKRLNVLNMLSTQIAISLENANLYETLEDKVNKRTEELSKANKEIKQQADELQIKNNQLVELDNFKQAMTNMIVHDLKNPLSSIINVPENQNAKDQLEKVRHLGHKMLHIVMNVLDVQKYEETVMELKQKNTAVNDIINQAIQQVDYLAKENSVTIIQDPIPDVFVLVDEPIAERILINILTNAIKFAPVGTAVELSVKIDGGNVVFSVKDEGPGIAKEDQALVFEKYAQVKAKKSGNIRSTGLGLTFCKIAVEAHSGTIGITSDKGKGTEVWFTLPKSETGSQQIKGAQKPGSKAIKKQHYAFSADEKAMLVPVIEKLKSYKLYELTNMLAVLKTIDTESSELISNWCKEIIVCINRFNQKRFNELLDEVEE